MMVGCTGASHILKQFKDGMLGNARHADDGIDARPFHEGGDDLDALCCREPIHNKNSIIKLLCFVKVEIIFL